MSSFIVFALLLLGSAQYEAIPVAAPPVSIAAIPQIGDPYRLPQGRILMTVASAQAWPYETVEVLGVTYGIGVNTNTLKVAYIDTNDPKFKTSEGLAVGSTLSQVLATGAERPRAELGWAFHTQLRSGWSAAFVITDDPLEPTSKVAFFFKRE